MKNLFQLMDRLYSQIQWFDSLKTTLYDAFDTHPHKSDIETATHKLFTAISDNKIKLYGIQFNPKNRDTLEYIQIISLTPLKLFVPNYSKNDSILFYFVLNY